LHRHRPPAEIDHLRAEAHMLGVERGLFESGIGGHGRERKWWHGRVNPRGPRTIRRLQSPRLHPELAPFKIMPWIDRAETKFGHLAIPGLLRYIAGFNALCFVLIKLNPPFYAFLHLDPTLILQGQVWRLFTFIFIPVIGGIFPDWLGAAMYVLYFVWIGDGLEQAMGAFRLTLFYFLGMLGTIIAGFIAHADPSGFLLNTSLLFAFARFYPDLMIYLFFVLPVKVKWLAWISGAFVLFGFVTGALAYQAAVLVALGNFLLFFGREILHDARQRREVSSRRRRFEEARQTDGDTLHRCAVCGRTEVQAPELEFRVARDGHEYCREHLPKAPPASRA
jgi:hypothetical protein